MKPKETLGGHFSVTKEPELTRPGATTAQNSKTGGMSTKLGGAKKSSLGMGAINPTKRLRITQRITQRIPAEDYPEDYPEDCPEDSSDIRRFGGGDATPVAPPKKNSS